METDNDVRAEARPSPVGTAHRSNIASFDPMHDLGEGIVSYLYQFKILLQFPPEKECKTKKVRKDRMEYSHSLLAHVYKNSNF